MATPELIVANASYKTYPGGVVVVRCKDWLGSSGATVVTDTRSCEGQVVRETQQAPAAWSSAVAPNLNTEYAAVADTLVIPLGSLPLEFAAGGFGGLSYILSLSVLVEGDWDETNTKTTNFTNNRDFDSQTCAIAMHGPNGILSSSPRYPWKLVRKRSAFYHTNIWGSSGVIVASNTSDVLRIRALAQPGTTIAILLDQIVFLPRITASGTFVGGWKSDDFAYVGGAQNDFNTITSVDGADGGDVNGKYTLIPYATGEFVTSWGDDGGGDYQKKSSRTSAEYMFQMTSEDYSGFIWNSQTHQIVPVETYSLCGPNHHLNEELSDNFARTVNWPAPAAPGGWYTNNQFKGYLAVPSVSGGGTPTYMAVNGSYGIIFHGGVVGGAGAASIYWGGNDPAGTQGTVYARIEETQGISFTGRFRTDNLGVSFGATPNISYEMGFYTRSVFGGGFSAGGPYNIHINASTNQWWITLNHQTTGTPVNSPTGVIVAGPFTIGSFYVANSNPSAWVGWRIEFRRFRLLARVWDASSAEPSTWDYDSFRSIWAPFHAAWGSNIYPYDYAGWAAGHPSGEAQYWTQNFVANYAEEPYFPYLYAIHGGTAHTSESHWDDIKITMDRGGGMGGTTTTHQSLESTTGSLLGEITVPAGAQYWIYWGKQNLASINSFTDGPYLGFSTRAWNDVAASDLQRAEAPVWWFRSSHVITKIIPMNFQPVEEFYSE